MIALEPIENLANRQATVAEAAAHGEAHRAPGGIGWTAIYVAPPSPISILTRELTLASLVEVLGPSFAPASKVVSGYSTHREDVASAFAFRRAGTPFTNVIYGATRGKWIADLNVSEPDADMVDTLHQLGTAFRLLACDLWQDAVVDLADRTAVARYLG